MSVTVIRRASWVIHWEGGRHVYSRDIDVAFDHDGILHVGPDWQGQADQEVDGRNWLVMPGLVNIHCHSGDEPLAKGLFDDVGTPELWGNALYEFSTLIDSDADAKAACQTLMLSELLKSGVTSCLDIAGDHEHWLGVATQSGMRVWLAPVSDRPDGGSARKRLLNTTGTRLRAKRQEKQPYRFSTGLPPTRQVG